MGVTIATVIPYSVTGQWQQPPKSGRAGLADLAVEYQGKTYVFRDLDKSLSATEAQGYAENRLGINQVWVQNAPRANVAPRELADLFAATPKGDQPDLVNLPGWMVTLANQAVRGQDRDAMSNLLIVASSILPATTISAWSDLLANGIPDPDYQPGYQTSKRLAGDDWYNTPQDVPAAGWTWDDDLGRWVED